MFLKTLTRTGLRFNMNLGPEMRKVQSVLVEIERALIDLNNNPSQAGQGNPRIPLLLAGDDNYEFSAGDFIVRVLVKPVSDLPGFKIGDLFGTDNMISEQFLAANEWKSFTINEYCEDVKTLFFGGITSPVEMIIFYEPGITSNNFKVSCIISQDSFFPFTSGIYAVRALVKLNEPIANFKIGTTQGGEDIISSQALDIGWNKFDIDHYFQDTGNLYFSGVTSPIQIILYYE